MLPLGACDTGKTLWELPLVLLAFVSKLSHQCIARKQRERERECEIHFCFLCVLAFSHRKVKSYLSKDIECVIRHLE